MDILNDHEIRRDFASQLARMDAALLRGDIDLRWNLRCAITLYWELKQRWQFEDLGAAEDLNYFESIVSSNISRRAERDRNVIRKIRLPSSGINDVLVLKCELPYVNSVPMTDVLHYWHENHLPCVTVYAGGFELILVGGRAQEVEYSLMEYIKNNQCDINHATGNNFGKPIEECLKSIVNTVQFIKPFHALQPSAPLRNTRTWTQCWFSQLYVASGILETEFSELGWNGPSLGSRAWRHEIDSCSAGTSPFHRDTKKTTLLHGNLKSTDVLVPSDTSRESVLIDPMGGIKGIREWDIGSLCVFDVSMPGALPTALEAALTADTETTTDNYIEPLDRRALAYAAAIQALFTAANIVKDFSYEHEDPTQTAKEWIAVVKWALEIARN